MSTHIRVSEKTKKLFRELKRAMSYAFNKDYSDDDLLRELIKNRIELEVYLTVPEEWKGKLPKEWLKKVKDQIGP